MRMPCRDPERFPSLAATTYVDGCSARCPPRWMTRSCATGPLHPRNVVEAHDGSWHRRAQWLRSPTEVDKMPPDNVSERLVRQVSMTQRHKTLSKAAEE